MSTGIGLSALRAASEAIDATSNNIANAQTVGYKAGQYVFQDQFFRATDPQNPNRTGMGIAVSQIRRPQTNGTIVSTSNPLDLAIGGIGMFTTAKGLDSNTKPINFQYTRNGQFGVDSNSRIINENGNYLVGYPANPDGTINTSSSALLTLDQTPLPGAQTQSSKIEVNLDDSQPSIPSTPFSPLNPASYSQSTSQVIYDTTGVSHTLSVYYQKDGSVPLTITPTSAVILGQSASFTYNAKQPASGSNPQVATTASTASGNNQLLQNSTITHVSGSTYLMTLEDKSTLTVTGYNAGGSPVDTSAGGVIDHFTVNTSRYSVYATLDGNPVAGPGITSSSATTTSGSRAVPISAANSSISVGQTVSGAGISSGTTVTIVGATNSANATTTSGQNTLTVAANSSIAVGQTVSGTGITNGTTVTSVSTLGGTTTVTLSSNATASGNPSLTFTGNVINLSAAATASGSSTLSFTGGPLTGYPAGDPNSYAINSVAQSALGTMAFVGGRNIDSLGGLAGGASSSIAITATTSGSTPNNVAFNIDTSTTSAYAGSTQTITNSQDGAPLSQLSSYSFDSTGKLVAVYTNGQSVVKGQVKLATFTNDEGLIPIGGNSFEQSAISGEPVFGTASNGIFGGLKAQALEQSNVDLTSQLVTLMALQRQYSASSQVVKTSTSLMDDILNKLS